MKRCTTCDSWKPEQAFNKKKSSKDGLQTKCRECSKRLAKAHYRLNEASEKDRIYSRREEIRRLYVAYKEGLQCLVCGEGRSCCLDFHHKNQDKEANICEMVQWGHSWIRILKEIKKCVPLCSNCHRKIHANEMSLSVG